MSRPWPKAPLGEVLRRSKEAIEISPDHEYREITVRLWGKGVGLRGIRPGSEISEKRRYIARANQFILSRIDARNGAMGIVPPDLDGAILSNDFPVFEIDRNRLDPNFLGWLARTSRFVERCREASKGTTNRIRLNEDQFLSIQIPLPPIEDQRSIVAWIDAVASKIDKIRVLSAEVNEARRQLLRSVFCRLAKGATRAPMGKVAPLVRRPVQIDVAREYPELGVRSFGKGTFHKPPLPGAKVGSKRLYEIHAGDLVFNNVFAWEGAVAVAQESDSGRFGSHRFITCVPTPGVVTAPYLCFYFLTDEGLEQLGEASPGGAGRNRTLGLDALSRIEVPVIPYSQQLWFDQLQDLIGTVGKLSDEAVARLDALFSSVLDRAFYG